jgi:hypothetical protein
MPGDVYDQSFAEARARLAGMEAQTMFAGWGRATAAV